MFVLLQLVHVVLPIHTSATSSIIDTKELSEQLRTMMLNELKLHSSQAPAWKYSASFSRGSKIGESLHTLTPNGICKIMDRIEISDCFTYSIHPQTPALSVKISMSVRPKVVRENLTVTLYEVNHWSGKLNTLGRAYIDSQETNNIRSLRIEILRNAKKWFNGFSDEQIPIERRLKVEVLADNRLCSYFDFFSGPPELDFSYYDNGMVRSKCDPLVECCLIPHYVNFTEIGWNKFIMYPVGFYANYCIGPSHSTCTHENPEVEVILSTAEAQSELPRKSYVCAPRKFAPLRILYHVGPNHTMRLRLDDMIAMTCSCIS